MSVSEPHEPRHWSVAVRMTLLSVLMVILTAALVSAALHLHEMDLITETLGSCLMNIAATGALVIDADAHARIQSREDTDSEDFRKIEAAISSIIEANKLPPDAVYTLRPIKDADGNSVTEFVAMAGTPFTGDHYQFRKEMMEAVETRQVTCTREIYEDQYGAWLSAYAPIIASDGTVDGILEVDYRADHVTALSTQNRNRTMVYAALCAFIAALLSVLTVRRSLRPLKELTHGIRALGGGEYGHRVKVEEAAAELAFIAGSFNEMAEAIEGREASLASSERRYRSLFDASREAIFVVDAEGLISDLNPAAETLAGRDRQSLLDASFCALFFPTENTGPPCVETLLAQTRDSGADVAENLMVKTPKGDVRCVDLRASAIDLDGVPAVLIACWDVTRQRREWAQLLQTSKLAALGEMAGGLAHEINNPLVGVLNFAQLLVRALPEGSRNRQLAETIEEGATRCRDIVRALLRFGRRDSITFGTVSINSILDEAQRLSSHQVQLRGGTLDIETPKDLSPIWGNTVQLVQVLLNLIGNASQAIDKAQIAINTRTEAGQIIISVKDNGPGIDPNIRNRVFEPFFTTKDEGEGTGLGLSLAYSIVHQHGGELRLVDSDVGATFEVALPTAISLGIGGAKG